jgi:hypothetical protein
LSFASSRSVVRPMFSVHLSVLPTRHLFDQ